MINCKKKTSPIIRYLVVNANTKIQGKEKGFSLPGPPPFFFFSHGPSPVSLLACAIERAPRRFAPPSWTPLDGARRLPLRCARRLAPPLPQANASSPEQHPVTRTPPALIPSHTAPASLFSARFPPHNITARRHSPVDATRCPGVVGPHRPPSRMQSPGSAAIDGECASPAPCCAFLAL